MIGPKSQEVRMRLQELKQERANLLTSLRSEMLNQAAKSLGVINGGLAIALGTLLQALWPEVHLREWKYYLLWAIGAAALGVLCAAVQPVLRYFTSFDKAALVFKGGPWWKWQMGAFVASGVAFAVGVVLTVYGGLQALR